MLRIDDNWCEAALAVLEGVNANGLIASLNKRYTYDELKQFDFIASATTGVDHLDARDIPVISLAGEPGLKEVYATAEHTFALILSLIRKVPFAFDDVKQGNWDRDAWQGSELHGKTLGIVGYGRVGQQVANIGNAFGMNVLFCDAKEIKKYLLDMDYFRPKTQCSFDVILRNSDIITVHTPLNDETRYMFDYPQFKAMKPTAYFINTSRGGVVSEDALIEALDNKWIAGAAIDVAQCEPNIWGRLPEYASTHDNLIITPHIAGNTAESREKTQLMLAAKIKAFVNSRAVLTEDACHSHRKAGVCDGVI